MGYVRKFQDEPMAFFTREYGKDKRDWLDLRKQSIGGSDAATTLGLNPWKTTEQLWEEKLEMTKPEDISSKEAVVYGQRAEKPLADLFVLDFPSYKLYRKNNMLLRNKKLTWMTYSPDGELIDEQGRKGLLEIKTTTINQSMQREKWNDKIPDNYFCQILHGLLVTGYDFVVLKAQLKSIWPEGIRISTKHYFFERRDVEMDMRHLLKAEMNFWEYVSEEKRPPLILPPI